MLCIRNRFRGRHLHCLQLAGLLYVVLAVVLGFFRLGLDFVLTLLLLPLSAYLVFAPKDNIAFSHRNASLSKSFKHSWSVPEHTLHAKVINHFGFELFDIIDCLL